jgi:uncharacterized protein (TIGR03067 family)
MMTRIGSLAPVMLVILAVDADGDQPKKPGTLLAGTWLFDSAMLGEDSRLGMVWTSKLMIDGNSFFVSKFLGLPKDLKGSFILDPSAEPKKIDLKFEEFDLSKAGAPMKIPACTLSGIYKREGDRLTISFNREAGGIRPARFDKEADSRHFRLTFQKAAPDFKEFPEEVTIRVSGPDGKPAAGATVAGFMSRRENRENKDDKAEWNYIESSKTGTDGAVKLPFETMPSEQLVIRDVERKLMAIAAVSPAALVRGEVNVKLVAERVMAGTLVCDELKRAGRPIGWTNVYLMHKGQRVATCDSSQGRFEFIVPPGSYTLNAYGSDLKGRYVPVTVSADSTQFVVDPIHLTASRLLLLQGRPAPEPEGIVGWKGRPVKLADLKGKYVLLEFWGYWCGPCVGSIPVLIELHEKFADQGLAIVGIHLDTDGEVDTPAKLDEKLEGFKKELWSGKDLPFPVGLASGKQIGDGDESSRGAVARQYGVTSYPTTVLIDRDGNVVGRFHARDIKAARAQVEKLLGGKK